MTNPAYEDDETPPAYEILGQEELSWTNEDGILDRPWPLWIAIPIHLLAITLLLALVFGVGHLR